MSVLALQGACATGRCESKKIGSSLASSCELPEHKQIRINKQWRLVPMGCRAAAPPHVFLICFFRIFYNVNIFYYVIVHTLFTNAPAYVAEKTNFPILLALS